MQPPRLDQRAHNTSLAAMEREPSLATHLTTNTTTAGEASDEVPPLGPTRDEIDHMGRCSCERICRVVIRAWSSGSSSSFIIWSLPTAKTLSALPSAQW